MKLQLRICFLAAVSNFIIMRKIILITLIGFVSFSVLAQKKSGKISYKIANVDFVDKGTNADVTATNDAAKKQLYQLNFNQTIVNFFLPETLSRENGSDFHNTLAKIIVSKYDYYIDHPNKIILELSSDGTIIKKELIKLPWNVTSEGKMIGQYQCYKATYTFEYLARNQKMKTRVITAWFAPSLPYPYGPKDYYGLPGLILELTEGDITFLVSKIELFDSEVEIKLPNGKRIDESTYLKKINNR
jgi:GLPGLI family protein